MILGGRPAKHPCSTSTWDGYYIALALPSSVSFICVQIISSPPTRQCLIRYHHLRRKISPSKGISLTQDSPQTKPTRAPRISEHGIIARQHTRKSSKSRPLINSTRNAHASLPLRGPVLWIMVSCSSRASALWLRVHLGPLLGGCDGGLLVLLPALGHVGGEGVVGVRSA